MANIASAKKRNRQNVVRTLRNVARKNKVKTAIKNLEAKIVSGNAAEAQEAFNNVQSVMAKVVKVGTIKKQTASRKISRLNAKIKAIS